MKFAMLFGKITVQCVATAWVVAENSKMVFWAACLLSIYYVRGEDKPFVIPYNKTYK